MDKFTTHMLKILPELAPSYQEYIQNTKKPFFSTFLDEIATPTLIAALSSGKDKDYIKRFFQSLDELPKLSDKADLSDFCYNILMILSAYPALLQTAQEYMSPEMRTLSGEIVEYRKFTADLPRRFPELKSAYDELMSWGGPEGHGPHVVYGDVFNTFVLDVLNRDNNEALLRRIFDHLEEMATSKNELIVNVLRVTTLEMLGEFDKFIAKANLYMKPETRKLGDEMNEYLKRGKYKQS